VQPIRSHREGTPARVAGSGGSGTCEPNASVYPPREDTRLLLPFADVPRGTLFLEVGTGTGLAAIAAARRGARVVATDLNPHALRQLRARALEENVDLAVVRTDLARGLGRFDRILANPPYLPTRPEERDPDRWHNLALDGGSDGCRVTARLIDELDRHLAPGGSAFVVVSSRQDAESLARIRSGWEGRGGTLEVVESRRLEGERLDVWRLELARG
jgi:release factor glutamine methyltransferase